MASHNPIDHSTTTLDTPTSRTTSRRLRSLVWWHFRRVDKTINEKRVIKVICKYYKKILNSSTNGTSHLKRHADKCVAKNLSNVSTSQSHKNFTESGGMDNFSYSNIRMREGLAIYTVAAEQPYKFGADPKFEHF